KYLKECRPVDNGRLARAPKLEELRRTPQCTFHDGAPAHHERGEMCADFLCRQPGCIARANHGADRATGNDRGPNAEFVEGFEHRNVGNAARSATAKRECDAWTLRSSGHRLRVHGHPLRFRDLRPSERRRRLPRWGSTASDDLSAIAGTGSAAGTVWL